MTKSVPPSEATKLLQQVQAGDSRAGTSLLELYRPLLLDYVERRLDRRLRAKAGASDIVQQSIVEAWRTIHQFNPDGLAAFWKWLRRIADHNILDLNRKYRRRKADMTLERPHTSADIRALIDNLSIGKRSDRADNLERQETAQKVHAALAGLSEEYRVILRWRYDEKVEYQEIGARIDRSEDAARMLCRRARMAFKREYRRITMD